MTMPYERTRALIFARELLEELRDRTKHPETTEQTKHAIYITLRHFPEIWEMNMLADAAPDHLARLDDPELKRLSKRKGMHT